MNVSVNVPMTPMDLMPVLPGLIRGMRADSLIDYAQPTRIEPMTLIDQPLYQQPYMEDVMQTLLNIFAGYYSQAISLSAEIKGISVVRRLDPFNPRRDPVNSLADGIASMVAIESFEETRFGLPSLEAMKINVNPSSQNPMNGRGQKEPGYRSFQAPTTASTGRGIELSSRETLQALRENSNLAVGKMIEVSVVVDDKSVKIPVNVRLHTIPTPSSSMVSILTAGAQNRSPKERWYEFKADKLRFFKDLIGVADLLDAHRKNILKDPTGLYLKTMRDKRRNAVAGALSGKPSIAQASNIVVITEETAVSLERALNIKLSSSRGRRILEANSAVMLLLVLDRDYNQATLYHRGLETATTMSIDMLKNAGKSSGPDITKLFEMYKMAKAPTF